MRCVNPFDESESEFPETPVCELDALYAAARTRAREWGKTPLARRQEALSRVCAVFRSRAQEVAAAISREMGKPLRFSRIEVARALDECEYNLEHAAQWLNREEAPGGYVRFDPVGVVGVISPWNFPLLLPLRAIFPALLAGNAVLFKPSELTLGAGRMLHEVFATAESGIPLFTAYGGKDLGAALSRLPLEGIAFTGSTAAGKKIAAGCGEHLKHLSLELGGLDAALVLEDADVAAAAPDIIKFATANSGQVCNAVKRVYVPEKLFREFSAAAAAACSRLALGDPLDEKTDLGPLVSAAQRDRVASFVHDTVQKGARVLCGGKRPARKGFFFEATLLADVPADALLLREEPFGPVLPLISYRELTAALSDINAVPFGLTASIWTKNVAQAEALAAELDVGTVSINTHSAGGPGAPWGGCKQSGLGRMKTREGMREFTNVKFVHEA